MILFGIGLVMIMFGVGIHSISLSFLVCFTGLAFMFGGVFYMIVNKSEYIDLLKVEKHYSLNFCIF